MKKIVITITLLFGLATHAQKTEGELINVTSAAEAKVKDTTNMGWKRGGNFSFLFNQSAFNNEWLGGGTSSIAGNVGVNYDFNYKTPQLIWDNKIIIAYGLTKLKSERMAKTDDRIEFTSLLGKKAGQGYWFYSAFLNFRTQMDSGFSVADVTTGTTTEKVYTKISHFFSPAYLQAGPGMLWKKSENLKVNIAPATSRLIIVHDEFTVAGSAFGVEQGKTTRFEFGAALNAYYKLKLMDNITMENILNLYTNYLEKPQNVDVDYQMNLVMNINKYISANIAFQAIYDDNAIKHVQIREVFGLGLNYGF
jgi:Protein of unknown function (DUF3078)